MNALESKGSGQGYHDNRNAVTYMLAGESLGRGLIELLTGLLQIGPLSLWERVRVRAIRREISCHAYASPPCPHPRPLSQRERGD